MRIAFFHNLPSGGGKRSAHEWVKQMGQRHEVDLFLYDSKAEDFLDIRPFVRKTNLIPSVKVDRVGGLGRLLSLKRAFQASQQVAQLINNGKYDLAFIMQCHVSNSPFVLRYLRIPSLYFCHEPLVKIMEPHCQGKWKEGRLAPLKRTVINWMINIDRENARRATLICANSLYSRENIYRAYGVYPRLNYPGVDAQEFHPQHLQRQPTVLCVGSLNPAKGHDFVIKSVGSIKEHERPAIKLIYNSSYYREDFQGALTALAKRLGVEISFDKLVSDDDLVTAYNTTSITVCPNLLEPFGLVPIESMACGTPVVGIAEGGIRETIQHNETGLFTERDPREFGEAIRQLMTNKQMREKMGECGRKRVQEKWTWEKSYEQLEKNIKITIEKFNSSDGVQ